jgi:hypothetical protein
MISTDTAGAPARRVALKISSTVAVLFFVNSILRGIRTPGRWAATHFLFNYDMGFSKRALLGAIVAALDRPSVYHYPFFFWFAVVIFAADAVLLVALVKRLFGAGDCASKLAAWLFCSSLAVVYFAHTIGYFEQISLLVTLLALRARGFYARAFLVGFLFGASLLIHETGFLIFFPLIFLRFLADLSDRRDGAKVATLLALSIGLSALVISVGQAHLSPALAEAMRHSLQVRADYHLRVDAFDVLTRTIRDSLKLMGPWWLQWDSLQYFLFELLVTLPTALYFSYKSCTSVSRAGYSRVVTLVVAGASFAPLSLHLLGIDFARWDTLAVTTSFLVFGVVRLNFVRASQASRELTDRSEGALAAALVALNLGSSIDLFDNYIVQSVPYEGHITDVMNMLSGQAPFPPRPEKCLPDEPDCH